MGGSSRSDVQSLALLNPLLIACCGVALLFLRTEHLKGRKSLLAGTLLAILLVAIYRLPVSEQILSFAGTTREVTTARAAAYVSGASPTLSIVPFATSQSLFFLFAPLTVLLFALHLNRNDLRLSVLLLIAAGVISGLIGVLQLAGSAGGPLYFYQITNNSSAVGLFANRNHSSVFLACLFPMLALFASKLGEVNHGRNTPQLFVMAIAVTLVPLILVTGSRSGMLTAIIGLSGSILFYVSSGQTHRGSKTGIPLVPVLAVAIVACLVFATIYFSRAEAIERIFVENGTVNDRADFWTSSLHLFWRYFPFGFGPGGFVPAFQNTEPSALLDFAYLNRLHNDWLETALTFGVPGILLMLVGVVYYLRRSFVLWMVMDGQRSAVALGRMASIVLAILGIASLSDYPLRTPAMAGFAALVLVWFAHARKEPTVG